MNPRRLILTAGLVSLGVVVIAGKEAFASYKEPEYRTLMKRGTAELREYPTLTVAEVTVEGHGDDQANKAFSILAGYIFGKNQSRKKIAMTTPVTQQVSSQKIAMTAPVTRLESGEDLTMRFFMPSEYKMETLPIPGDKKIRIVQIPKQKFAVVKFSGSASDKNFDSHLAALYAFVQDIGMKPTGDKIRAYYNPPWTLPFLKRNEIWIPVS